MGRSCSKALQSVSALARIDDFFFESELTHARPLNSSDTAGTGLIVEANSLQEGPCEIFNVGKDVVQSGSDQRRLGRKNLACTCGSGSFVLKQAVNLPIWVLTHSVPK